MPSPCLARSTYGQGYPEMSCAAPFLRRQLRCHIPGPTRRCVRPSVCLSHPICAPISRTKRATAREPMSKQAICKDVPFTSPKCVARMFATAETRSIGKPPSAPPGRPAHTRTRTCTGRNPAAGHETRFPRPTKLPITRARSPRKPRSTPPGARAASQPGGQREETTTPEPPLCFRQPI